MFLLYIGRARPGKDVALFFSHSGNTDECVKAATHLNQRGVTTLCIVGNKGGLEYCMYLCLLVSVGIFEYS